MALAISFWTYLFLISVASATQVGSFESEACVDPTGMESCHSKASTTLDKCLKDSESCGKTIYERIDCETDCVRSSVQDRISCAATHCWDQVYSCEYQLTVSELPDWQYNGTLDGIPFYPTPENAPGSCSCNFSKITSSFVRIVSEKADCEARVPDSSKADKEEPDDRTDACGCCQLSGILSAFPAVCPEHNLTALGLQSYEKIFDPAFWSRCGELLERFPCESQEMGFTPPGGNDEGKFYKPGEFDDLGGTQIPSNMPGTVTAPVSGITFTWTHEGREMPVTVAKADAEPTGNPGKVAEDGSKDKDSGSGKGSPASLLVWLLPGTAFTLILTAFNM